jgi:hypothetical protein
MTEVSPFAVNYLQIDKATPTKLDHHRQNNTNKTRHLSHDSQNNTNKTRHLGHDRQNNTNKTRHLSHDLVLF